MHMYSLLLFSGCNIIYQCICNYVGTTIQTRTTGTEIINMKHSTPQYTEGLRRIEQIAIASVSTFIITSISFFIIGILCNKFCCKQKAVETHTEDENPNLLRANVQPHQQQQLELNTNVAYGLVRHH